MRATYLKVREVGEGLDLQRSVSFLWHLAKMIVRGRVVSKGHQISECHHSGIVERDATHLMELAKSLRNSAR